MRDHPTVLCHSSYHVPGPHATDRQLGSAVRTTLGEPTNAVPRTLDEWNESVVDRSPIYFPALEGLKSAIKEAIYVCKRLASLRTEHSYSNKEMVQFPVDLPSKLLKLLQVQTGSHLRSQVEKTPNALQRGPGATAATLIQNIHHNLQTRSDQTWSAGLVHLQALCKKATNSCLDLGLSGDVFQVKLKATAKRNHFGPFEHAKPTN